MLNDTKHRILIEHLKNDKTTELMPHDLRAMLDQELTKSADQVDTQLVRDLLDLLEEEAPTQKSKEECWDAIQKQTQKQGNKGRNVVLRRICTVAAALVLVVFVSFETAKAFNWTFLLKLLGPTMETFGIYSAYNPISSTDESVNHEYADEDIEYGQVNYTKLEDMPTKLNGYTIVPGWVPERYTFETGSVFEGDSMTVVSLFFRNEGAYLSFSISFYENEEDTSAFVYESYTESEHSIQVEEQLVTYYFNDTGEIRAASAIAQNVHVYIGGSITEYELEQIIASMN